MKYIGLYYIAVALFWATAIISGKSAIILAVSLPCFIVSIVAVYYAVATIFNQIARHDARKKHKR